MELVGGGRKYKIKSFKEDLSTPDIILISIIDNWNDVEQETKTIIGDGKYR